MLDSSGLDRLREWLAEARRIVVLTEVGSKRAFRGADLFVAIGTSGLVWPAAGFVRWARFEHARTVLIDPAPTASDDWSLVITARAEEILPRLVDQDTAIVRS